MDDLIRRSDAENIFRRARRAMKPENYSGQEFFIRDNILLNAEQIVHFIPTVDAVEVRHGEWIEFGEPNGRGEYEPWYWMCSECAAVGLDTFNYCPKCGARMDGRREDGDGDG